MGLAGRRVVFLGTPEFAVPSLAALLRSGHQVLQVVTQPDRPKGRKQELAQSAVKQFSLAQNLPVYQPERVRRPEAVETLRALRPDLMVVVGYGQILPQVLIDVAPLGILNVHASLLPKLRGAAPVQWSIANGDSITGVTTMRINAGLDTGDVLLRATLALGADEDAVELAARLSVLGAELLVETVERLETIQPEKQDDAQATFAPILTKEHGQIDWHRAAPQIHNQVRAFVAWPGAHTTFRGRSLHVWKARLSDRGHNAAPGSFLSGRDCLVACGNSTALELLEVQAEGRKRLPGTAFLNGLHLHQNEILGAISG